MQTSHEPAPWPHSIGAAFLGNLGGGLVTVAALTIGTFIAIAVLGIEGLEDLGSASDAGAVWDIVKPALGALLVSGLVGLALGVLATAALYKLCFRLIAGRRVTMGRALGAALAALLAWFALSVALFGGDAGLLGLVVGTLVAAWLLRGTPPAKARLA